MDYATIKYSQPLGIKSISTELPTEFVLNQNYPNPFNPTTIINYQLPISNYVKLSIYDILGRELEILINGKQNAGAYQVEWDATNYPSGVYFYRLSGTEFTETKKLILLK